jgi:RNA polymerase-binding transcription factor DksA
VSTEVLLGRSGGHAADSIVDVAAASLSPRAVLSGQWDHQLRKLTDASIRMGEADELTSTSDYLAMQAIIDTTRAEMESIEAALERLAHQTYGRCETCGGPIDALRLAGLPTTRTCRRCPPSVA